MANRVQRFSGKSATNRVTDAKTVQVLCWSIYMSSSRIGCRHHSNRRRTKLNLFGASIQSRLSLLQVPVRALRSRVLVVRAPLLGHLMLQPLPARCGMRLPVEGGIGIRQYDWQRGYLKEKGCASLPRKWIASEEPASNVNTDSIRFELFEMMRKLTMTSVLVFVASGGLGQILVGLIVPPLPVTSPP